MWFAITISHVENRRLCIDFNGTMAPVWVQTSFREDYIANQLRSTAMLQIEVLNGSIQ